jgi:formamidopyrimidine-DNA glycosylase
VVFQETSWFSEDASGNGFPTETVDVSRGDNADFTTPLCSQRARSTPAAMVEGHGVHRVAVTHRRALIGKRFAATSPNGRFEQGARAIDGEPLRKIEAIGKNLFYFYGDASASNRAETSKVVHVHFGMSGRFGVFAADTAPEATANTRLRLEGHGMVALLSAMTVDLVDESVYFAKKETLGQDPLREDACPDTLWAKFSKSRKSVGLALMDQNMFAGVGNIYRAEILYKAGVHPDERCENVARETFDQIWFHTVQLMQRGFVNGSILTVDPEEALILGEPWTRRYVYNQTKCGRCRGNVRVWDMANRTVYACETCQPLSAGSPQTPKRGSKRETDEKKPFVPFVSHCAPDSDRAALMEPSRLTVAQLKATLAERGWPKGLKRTARKSELVEAVLAAGAAAAPVPPPATPAPAATHVPPLSLRGALSPGTKALESRMNSAKAAAREKLAAGEKGNVEHVALADDETHKLVGAGAKKKRAREKNAVAAAPQTPDAAEKKPAVSTGKTARIRVE